jgi:simple sugar transport system permease protein
VRRLARFKGANNEGVLALILLTLVVAMSLVSPVFLSLSTLFAIIRSAIVPMVFALGALLVIVSGGIDMSFAAIAVFASYTAVKLAQGGAGGLPLVAATALALGAAMGLANGALIARFRLPTLIVTLGTQGIFKGALLAYVGTRYLADIPPDMDRLATAYLVHLGGQQNSLPVLVAPVAVLVAAVAWFLRRTQAGRALYAVGGDPEAAHRAGIPVARLRLALYTLVGALAAAGGVLNVALSRNANPQALVGGELDVIAAVVLGGASIFGGRGSVLGTVLGVGLVQLINNSLLLMGVPTAWQRAAVGALLLAGVGVQAALGRRAAKRRAASIAEDA